MQQFFASADFRSFALELAKYAIVAMAGGALGWVSRAPSKVWRASVRIAEWVIVIHAGIAVLVGSYLYFFVQLDQYQRLVVSCCYLPLGYFLIAVIMGRFFSRQFWRGVRLGWALLILVMWALVILAAQNEAVQQVWTRTTYLVLFLEVQNVSLLVAIAATFLILALCGLVQAARHMATIAERAIDEATAESKSK